MLTERLSAPAGRFAIALEPFGLDQAATQPGGGLLILAGEIVLADGPVDAVEGFKRLPFGHYFSSSDQTPFQVVHGAVVRN